LVALGIVIVAMEERYYRPDAQVSGVLVVPRFMLIRRMLKLTVGLALVLAVPATAGAATVALPAVERTLTASSASSACTAGATDSTTYTAPMAGFVTTRLNAAGGDWDLTVTDARTHRSLSTSRAFGSHEVAQAWVTAGQRLVITGCRVSGSTGSATTSTLLVDAARPAEQTASIVRFKNLSQGQIQALEQAGFDPTENQQGAYTNVLVPSAAKLAQLKRTTTPFEMVDPDYNKSFAEFRAADARAAALGTRSVLPTGRSSYRYLADFQNEMKQIVDTYHDIARPVTIGRTFQGREIQGIEISSKVRQTDDGKPTYFVMGTHHAREWPAAEIPMEFAWMLAQGFGNDAALTALLRKERIVIVPIINVDGYVASRGENAFQGSLGPVPDPEDETGFSDTAEASAGGGSFAYRRKNCDGGQPAGTDSNDVARSMPCYYAYGVDPNRNYGLGWGGPGASNDPLTQVYRGAGQWSEPETQAVHAYSQTHPVTSLITVHTVSSKVLRPPGLHTAGKAPDENMLKDLGDRMAAVTGYASLFGFQLYDTSGTTEDWNYGAVGTLGYTIELGPPGNTHFHAPYQQGVVDVWTGKFHGRLMGGMHDALLFAAEAGADPKSHSIISGTGTPGATLQVTKAFDTESAQICTFAQGWLTAGSPISPLDCVAPGAAFASTKQADHLTYTTKVPAAGSFVWHITQSTRPFVGFTYNDDTDERVSTGKTEAWTLTCTAPDGTTLGTREVTIDRGEKQALGGVCS
jgi:murein tripeptide amidase MpaA